MCCAIYIRVSGKQQVKGVSLDDQLRACREYALRQGWSITESLYVEPGRSAFTENLSSAWRSNNSWPMLGASCLMSFWSTSLIVSPARS